MPKQPDPKVKQRCLQQFLEHVSRYPNPIAAAQAIAKRNGAGAETVRRLHARALVDGGQRRGATTNKFNLQQSQGPRDGRWPWEVDMKWPQTMLTDAQLSQYDREMSVEARPRESKDSQRIPWLMSSCTGCPTGLPEVLGSNLPCT